MPPALPADKTAVAQVPAAKPETTAAKQVAKVEPTKPVEAKPADTKARETTPAETKDTKTADADDTSAPGEDDTSAAKLRDAQAALDGQDYAKAERFANAVINGESSGPIQKAKAHVIHGIVACVAHNALGEANADARALRKYPKLRSRLTSRCDGAGIQLTP